VLAVDSRQQQQQQQQQELTPVGHLLQHIELPSKLQLQLWSQMVLRGYLGLAVKGWHGSCGWELLWLWLLTVGTSFLLLLVGDLGVSCMGH
jgi:hypothetical protein